MRPRVSADRGRALGDDPPAVSANCLNGMTRAGKVCRILRLTSGENPAIISLFIEAFRARRETARGGASGAEGKRAVTDSRQRGPCSPRERCERAAKGCGGGRPGAPCEEHGVFRVKEAERRFQRNLGGTTGFPVPWREGRPFLFARRGAGYHDEEKKETV